VAKVSLTEFGVTRLLVAAAACAAGILAVALMNLLLPADTLAARLLVDKGLVLEVSGALTPITRPFAVQTFLWITFFVGLGEVALRFVSAWKENAQIGLGFLPESPEVLLGSKDLVPIFQAVRESRSKGFLARMIERVILQFQASKSVDRAGAMLSSSIDLFAHEIDLRYHMLRFLVWLVPSLGFLGTVVGIIAGLDVAAAQYAEHAGSVNLSAVTGALGVAFYTTWLALLMAAVLVLLMHVAQESEENALNRAGQYCLDHLINKLYEP